MQRKDAASLGTHDKTVIDEVHTSDTGSSKPVRSTTTSLIDALNRNRRGSAAGNDTMNETGAGVTRTDCDSDAVGIDL
jgi:hypothetical protein